MPNLETKIPASWQDALKLGVALASIVFFADLALCFLHVKLLPSNVNQLNSC